MQRNNFVWLTTIKKNVILLSEKYLIRNTHWKKPTGLLQPVLTGCVSDATQWKKPVKKILFSDHASKWSWSSLISCCLPRLWVSMHYSYFNFSRSVMELQVFELNNLRRTAFQARGLSRKKSFCNPGTPVLCYLLPFYTDCSSTETQNKQMLQSRLESINRNTHSYHPRSLKASGLSGLMTTVLEDRTDRLLPPKSETLAPLMATTGCLEPSNCSACMCEKTKR